MNGKDYYVFFSKDKLYEPSLPGRPDGPTKHVERLIQIVKEGGRIVYHSNLDRLEGLVGLNHLSKRSE